MEMNWFEKFIDQLAKLLKEPPYLLFVFISAILVIISIISQRFFDQTWTFFLYSIGGTIWRYIERDFLSTFEKKYNFVHARLIVISIYHIGNLILFFVFLQNL